MNSILNTSGYLFDGYERQGYIREQPYQFPEVRFIYRVPLARERAIIRHHIANSDPATAEEIAAQATCKYLKSWDFKDHQGKPVQVSPEIMLNNIDPAVFQRVYMVVMGFAPSDIDPKWPQSVKKEALSEDLQRVLGKYDQDKVEADDVKN